MSAESLNNFLTETYSIINNYLIDKIGMFNAKDFKFPENSDYPIKLFITGDYSFINTTNKNILMQNFTRFQNYSPLIKLSFARPLISIPTHTNTEEKKEYNILDINNLQVLDKDDPVHTGITEKIWKTKFIEILNTDVYRLIRIPMIFNYINGEEIFSIKKLNSNPSDVIKFIIVEYNNTRSNKSWSDIRLQFKKNDETFIILHCIDCFRNVYYNDIYSKTINLFQFIPLEYHYIKNKQKINSMQKYILANNSDTNANWRNSDTNANWREPNTNANWRNKKINPDIELINFVLTNQEKLKKNDYWKGFFVQKQNKYRRIDILTDEIKYWNIIKSRNLNDLDNNHLDDDPGFKIFNELIVPRIHQEEKFQIHAFINIVNKFDGDDAEQKKRTLRNIINRIQLNVDFINKVNTPISKQLIGMFCYNYEMFGQIINDMLYSLYISDIYDASKIINKTGLEIHKIIDMISTMDDFCKKDNTTNKQDIVLYRLEIPRLYKSTDGSIINNQKIKIGDEFIVPHYLSTYMPEYSDIGFFHNFINCESIIMKIKIPEEFYKTLIMIHPELLEEYYKNQQNQNILPAQYKKAYEWCITNFEVVINRNAIFKTEKIYYDIIYRSGEMNAGFNDLNKIYIHLHDNNINSVFYDSPNNPENFSDHRNAFFNNKLNKYAAQINNKTFRAVQVKCIEVTLTGFIETNLREKIEETKQSQNNIVNYNTDKKIGGNDTDINTRAIEDLLSSRNDILFKNNNINSDNIEKIIVNYLDEQLKEQKEDWELDDELLNNSSNTLKENFLITNGQQTKKVISVHGGNRSDLIVSIFIILILYLLHRLFISFYSLCKFLKYRTLYNTANSYENILDN